ECTGNSVHLPFWRGLLVGYTSLVALIFATARACSPRSPAPEKAPALLAGEHSQGRGHPCGFRFVRRRQWLPRVTYAPSAGRSPRPCPNRTAATRAAGTRTSSPCGPWSTAPASV